jgi:hypothetical protein
MFGLRGAKLEFDHCPPNAAEVKKYVYLYSQCHI